jgi:hypothetical protein
MLIVPRRKVVASQPWTYAQLSPAVWLDARYSETVQLVGAGVAQWSDLSGNNRHYTQTLVSNRPTYETAVQNGFSAIRIINGPGSQPTRQYLDSAFAFGGNQISCFSVHLNSRSSPAASVGRLFSFAAQGEQDFSNDNGLALLYGVTTGIALYRNNRTIATTAAIDNQWCLVSSERNGTVGRVSLNGGPFVAGTTASANQNIARSRIGNDFSATNSGMNGWAVLKLIFFGALSNEDWYRVQGRAAHDLGFTALLPNDHPYKLTEPTL